MAPYWLPHCSQSTFPLVLLIARLAQSPSRARIAHLSLKTVAVPLLDEQKSNG